MSTSVDLSLMPNPGDVIAGRYEIKGMIGRGGGGVVFRANQIGIGRDVALKMLPPEHQLHAAAVRRFEREARLVSRLNHPNTVTLYEYNRSPNGLLYIVMELVEGIPLKQILDAAQPVSPLRAVPILQQICKSLAEAHAHGIVHRDLKPANVMLCNLYGEPDFVKVLDFGVATALEGEEANVDDDVTRTADVVGTPKYMAPEQFRSEPTTPKSDIYSLGCLAFELLAGYSPFDGETLHVTIAKHLFQAPPELPSKLHAFPILVETIHRMLAKTPDERPESVDEVLRQLENWDGVPGDRTVPAPDFETLMSFIEEHGYQQPLTSMADDTGRGMGGQINNTFPGYQTTETPNHPHLASHVLPPPGATPQNLVLPDAARQAPDRKSLFLAIGIGLLTLLALGVFLALQLGGSDDDAVVEDEAPASDENPTAEGSTEPTISDLEGEFSVEALERASLIHYLLDVSAAGVASGTIAGWAPQQTGNATPPPADAAPAEESPEVAPDAPPEVPSAPKTDKGSGADSAKTADPVVAVDDPAPTKKATPPPKAKKNLVTFTLTYKPPTAKVKVRKSQRAKCPKGKGSCKITAEVGKTVSISVGAPGYGMRQLSVKAESKMGEVKVTLPRRMN